MDLVVSPSNASVEALFPNGTVFGDRALREVVKGK